MRSGQIVGHEIDSYLLTYVYMDFLCTKESVSELYKIIFKIVYYKITKIAMKKG
jgi:hypothetical protein